ncbi:MAG: hypothetical protein ACRCW2_13345 [Cellulosilyticaceae bacterium]
MKKNLSNKAKALMVAGVVGVLGFSVVAAPVIEEVKAQLKYNLSYSLNGESILEDKGGLVYKDQVYLPLRDVANALGVAVEYKDGHVILGEAAPAGAKAIKEDQAPAVAETMTIKKATIVEVDVENKMVTVLPEGLKDEVINYIVLNVDETETSIGHFKNKMRYALADLEVGMEVSAIHKSMMTMSIPAQTPAISITILGESNGTIDTKEIETPEVKAIKGKILEINKETKTITIGESADPNTQTIVHTDKDTFIHHRINRRVYRFEDLEVGQNVSVTPGPVMTASMPPQVTAVEVVLQD